MRCGAYDTMRCGAYGHAVHMVRCDAVHMIRCGAMHMTRCCSSLYKQDQSVYKPEHVVRCDAVHVVRCDAVHIIVANKKVALSALGENLLLKVVKKVDNAKIATYATISG